MSITSTIELYEQSREGSADSRVGTMTRRFLVPATRENALTFPGVPSINSPYTFNGKTVRCDRLDVSGTGDPAISEVIAAYSSDGRFSFQPKVDRTELNFARWSLSTTLQTRKVPSFVIETIAAPTVTDPLATKTRWARDDWQIEVPVTTFSSTVVVKEYINFTLNLILNQVGRIHRFGTFTPVAGEPYLALWRFKGHRATRIAVDRFEITYDWYADHGNAAFYTDSSPADPPPDGSVGLIGDHRIICTTNRNQFEEYLIVPPIVEGGTPGIITYQPFQTYINNPSSLASWALLPGDPIGGNP